MMSIFLWSPAVPTTDVVYIGVSDTYFGGVQDQERNQLVPCTRLLPPVLVYDDMERSCNPGIVGRYVYVQINELRVFG